MKITSGRRKAELDFDAIVKDLIAEHGTIFFAEHDGMSFIYKPLSRKDYKAIIESNELSDMQKEDEVCAMTVLWPKEIDWDDIEAGIPSKLYKDILQNSFLDSTESIAHLIEIYRSELELLDVQMSCIISEAFPNYDIEDIESWDMIKFCKIFSRAEWKLKNFNKVNDMPDVTDFLRATDASNSNNDYEEEEQQVQYQEQPVQRIEEPYSNSTRKVKVGTREMTQEEFRQYQEMQKMFPDIDWGADAMFTGYDTQTVDTTPVALR